MVRLNLHGSPHLNHRQGGDVLQNLGQMTFVVFGEMHHDHVSHAGTWSDVCKEAFAGGYPTRRRAHTHQKKAVLLVLFFTHSSAAAGFQVAVWAHIRLGVQWT